MVSYTPGVLQGLNFGLDLWKQQQAGQEQQQLQQYRALQMRETLAEMARKQRADALQQQYQTWLGSQAGGLLQGGSQAGALQGLRPLPPELQGTAPPQATGGMSGGGFALPQVPNASAQMAAPIGLRNQVLGLEGNQDYAIGRAGEIGPGQIMPATGAQYGYSPSQLYGDSGRYASGQIVNDLYRRSGGDAAATLVGYNRGPGAMARFQASGDNPSSVSLAPAYQKAVLADLSPEQQQHGSQAALAAAAAAPPQMIGQVGPGVYAGLIERLAGSNMSDEAKGYALTQLLPLMSKEGQEQFTQALDIAKLQQQGTEFGIRQGELQEQREFNRQFAAARLAQARGAQIFQTPDGRVLSVNPNTGQVTPLDVPSGSIKPGSQPRSAPAISLRAFIDEYTQKNGHPPSAADIRDWQAGTAEATSEARATGTRVATLDTATSVLDSMSPLLEEASNAVDRTEYPTINKVLLAWQEGTGDEKVVQYGEMINEIRYLYARALSPTGQARVADLHHFDEVMNKAWSKGQIKAGLDQIKKSLDVERQVLAKKRAEMRGEKPAEAAPAASSQDSVPVPPGAANDPDGTGYKKDGAVWVKRGDKLIKTPGAEATQ